jgi:hypothetical protein
MVKERMGAGYCAKTLPSRVAGRRGSDLIRPNELVIYDLNSVKFEKDQDRIIMIIIDIYYLDDLNRRKFPVPIEKLRFSYPQLEEIKAVNPLASLFLKHAFLCFDTACIKADADIELPEEIFEETID